ncbi:hypothetical protein [Flavobacterium alkalisoli]|uniref:hypothetical protein n=1 Tax=Flavobacterium alkalisoli TaxID=2602769 RepID=UPI003A919C3B
MAVRAEEQNEYARDVEGTIRYILEVERGKKGYWCLGCGEEMQAVHRTIEGYRPYFRHDASDVSKVRKCTYSSEQARRFLVMDILARTKRIKVPKVYKYAPDGDSKVLLMESRFIEAASVRGNLIFYEDNEGSLCWGREVPDGCIALYRPEITFFDVHQKPLLLIAITEKKLKLTEETKVKVRSMGIDIVVLKPPKDTPEHIAQSLESTTNTKWIFNHVEHNTPYFQLSRGDREGISATDAEQIGLFRESFACRQSQISNLIRKIEKCLGTEHYNKTERDLRAELSGVESAAGASRTELDYLRKYHRERVEARYSGEIDAVRKGESEFQFSLGTTQEEVRTTERELEKRYLSERDALVSRRREVEQLISAFDDIERSSGAITAEQSSVEDEIRRLDARILELSRNRDAAPGRFELLKEQEQSRFERETERLRSALEGIPGRLEQERAKLSAAFEDSRERAIETITNRDSTGDSELAQGLKRLMDCRGTLLNWDDVQKPYDRIRKAYDSFRDQSYKEWN